jgi:plasmid maintenance system antidote protein VapI
MEINLKDIEFNPEKLEQALAEAKLSQTDFNTVIGFPSENTAHKVIKNKRKLSATELIRACVLLNKPASFFSNFEIKGQNLTKLVNIP